MPASPAQADAWLVTGSRHGVYDALPWIEPLKAFLRACVAARIPVVGVCFGHQILAEALGGRAVKSDKRLGPRRPGLRGRRPPRLDDGTSPTASPCARCTRTRSSPCRPTPTVLARSPHCEYAALAYGDPGLPRRHLAAAAPRVRRRIHGRAYRATRRHRLPRARPPPPPRLAGPTGAQPTTGRGMIVDFLHRAAATRAAA